jgi:glycosyltransferase involved in cell wall biosynthesis
MQQYPIVTIGMCVRNCETFIKDAIESVLNQDYPNDLIEIIVVDDGSTDNTYSIIKSYFQNANFSNKIFRMPWKGLGFARNIIVNNALGKYIIWVDGDMLIPRNFVRKLVEYMEKNPEIGIAKGKQSLIPGVNILGTLEAYSRAASRMVNYQSKKSLFKSLGTGGAIYRVKAIKDVGGFDKNLKGYGEDFDAELRIKAAGWKLSVVDVEFLDYERFKLTWKKLWTRYWIRGYNARYLLYKNSQVLVLYKMIPPVAAIVGFLHSLKLYRLTNRKVVFLMPIIYFFKMTAWFIGFLSGKMYA